MFLRTAYIFFALVALFAIAVDARPRGSLQSRQLTPEERSLPNAERLARGLPLRAPVLARFGARAPTPVKRGKPAPSPSASSSSFSGRIEVKNKTATVGFLENVASAVGAVDLKSDSKVDLQVKLSTTGATSAVSILATNAIFTGPRFIGGGGNFTLSSSTAGFVNVTNVPQTKAGAAPTPEGASAIWSIKKKSHQLTAQWINLDGSKPETTIAYTPAGNYLFLTANLTAWIEAANATAEAVDLFLVN